MRLVWLLIFKYFEFFFALDKNNLIFLGGVVEFRLETILKLTDTRARNSRMTLMHYLCKVLISFAFMHTLVLGHQ